MQILLFAQGHVTAVYYSATIQVSLVLTHMSINAYNKNDINSLGKVLKILGEPNRLLIVTSLGLECRPVTDVIKDTGLSQTNVSFHLRVLREAGLVRGERHGSFVYYCLPDKQLRKVIDQFRDWVNK
jgi:DNA-binding transcriptional ArsR family regulator